MGIYLNIHANKHEDKLHLDAHGGKVNGGVPGAIRLEVRGSGQWDDITIFTNNEEMALELAAAINAVTAKYCLKIAA